MTIVYSPGVTATISASATSVSASLNANLVNLRIFNEGPNTCFIRWGIGSQTAVLTDLPIPAGVVEVFDKGAANTAAVITSAASSAVVYITPGSGQ